MCAFSTHFLDTAGLWKQTVWNANIAKAQTIVVMNPTTVTITGRIQAAFTIT